MEDAWMKHLVALVLSLAILISLVPAWAEGEYQYDAMTLRQIYLRKEADADSRKTQKVPKGANVNVVEFGEEWCLAEYKGVVGYAKREYLFKFHSHDPHKYGVPGYEKPYGLGTMNIEFNTKGMAGQKNSYSGNILKPGDLVTVHYYDEERDVATILVWRNYIELPAGAVVDIRPYVDHNSAQPGDLIAGYSSYNSQVYGYPLQKQRQHNLKTAVSLLNGAIVQPGEEYSFNSYAGPYEKEKGYVKGPIVGSTGVGYGGGSCQSAIVTYSGILGLPFRIHKHSLHTDEGACYALQVCDITVGNKYDFTCTNLLPYAVRFDYFYTDGNVTMMIYRHE